MDCIDKGAVGGPIEILSVSDHVRNKTVNPIFFSVLKLLLLWYRNLEARNMIISCSQYWQGESVKCENMEIMKERHEETTNLTKTHMKGSRPTG